MKKRIALMTVAAVTALGFAFSGSSSSSACPLMDACEYLLPDRTTPGLQIAIDHVGAGLRDDVRGNIETRNSGERTGFYQERIANEGYLRFFDEADALFGREHRIIIDHVGAGLRDSRR